MPISRKPNHNPRGEKLKQIITDFSPTRTSAPVFSNALSLFYHRPVLLQPPNPQQERQEAFNHAWGKARNEQERRVATRDKIPYKKKWPSKREKETAEQLIKKNKEYGAKLGHLYKKYWDYEIDLDFKRYSQAVNEHHKKTFIKIAQYLRIHYWETSNGNLRINLLSETELDRGIYYITITDKWGNRQPVGEVLGRGRQVRETHKEARGDGAWGWKVKSLEVVREYLKKFFVDISDKRLDKGKHKQKRNRKTASNIKVYEPLNISENTRQIILKDIKIGKTQRIKRMTDKPLFKKWYYIKGDKHYFLIDTKYSGKIKESILDELPEGSIRSVVLNQGSKHTFFKQLWPNQ